MAKFTLTWKDQDNDNYETIAKVAKQNNLSIAEVEKLVDRFTDGECVTLQFDTEKGKCWVLFDGKEGVNDWKVERDVVLSLPDRWEKYTTGRESYIATLQAQIDEALTAYQQETDRKSPAAKNLLRFIEDTRQELNALKASNYDNGDDEGLISAVNA